ncbi:MAG: radical SAM family heme chaperone HemW [Coriobacteriia bacterium]|nr:radical SAM family heme chaperone HemW [Coriobacteriia bacterium]
MTDPLYSDIDGPTLPAHFYIHIPFCASKCSYCDFASVARPSEDVVRGVFSGIRSQLRRWSLASLDGVVDTVYFGGGTPSRYPEQVTRVLAYMREHISVRSGAEITVEANPDSLDAESVGVFAAAGVTRISVGAQSFDDSVLRVLGRRHDTQAAWDACRAVQDAGLDLSVDLICGVPGQSVTSWSESLARALQTGAGHASIYPLSVEEGTPLAVAIDTGLLDEPDPDMAAEMMVMAESALGYLGLSRYEVANYAEDDEHRSRHNLAYWTGRTYAGIGPAAHGMLDVETARTVGLLDFGATDVARVRYANANNTEEWLVGQGDSVETLTAAQVAREDVMLGLRLVRGVPAEQVEAAGLAGVLTALADDGLVELVNDDSSRPGPHWRTTQRGWLLGNQVFSRVWLAGE